MCAIQNPYSVYFIFMRECSGQYAQSNIQFCVHFSPVKSIILHYIIQRIWFFSSAKKTNPACFKCYRVFDKTCQRPKVLTLFLDELIDEARMIGFRVKKH
jgi:hypothetical protein